MPRIKEEGAAPVLLHDRDGIRVFCCRWEHLLPTLPKVDAVITDPPYGIGLDCANGLRHRGAMSKANDYLDVEGDDKPFDPSPFLGSPVAAFFGANHFHDRLPPGGSWLVWDKLHGLSTDKRELGFNDNADAELIWTSAVTPVRIIRHRWIGLMKGSERDEARLHPTQKPVKVMSLLIRLLTKPGDLVLDPFLGVGATALACRETGRRCVGCEVIEEYARTAVKRLENAEGNGFIKKLELFRRRRARSTRSH